MWRLTHITETDKPGVSCDHCGTAIKSLYHITDDNGSTMVIGSSCVTKFLNENFATPQERYAMDNTASKLKSVRAKIVAEWRMIEQNQGKNWFERTDAVNRKMRVLPRPEAGETRTDYINRRLYQALNMTPAVYTEWSEIFNQRFNARTWDSNYGLDVEQRARRMGYNHAQAACLRNNTAARTLNRFCKRHNVTPYDVLGEYAYVEKWDS